MKHPETLIQVFCKAPIAGEVKTRLIPHLGEEGALSLYKEMIQKTLIDVLNGQLADVEIWCTPTISDAFFDQFVLRRCEQAGDDLGIRMSNALTEGLKTAKKVVLIGADLPPLDADYLDHAINELDEHDIVLGPAEDGGYGLVGVRGSVPGMFTGIDWSTEKVLSQTCRLLNGLKAKYALLPLIWDVDRPEDLSRYEAWLNQT